MIALVEPVEDNVGRGVACLAEALAEIVKAPAELPGPGRGLSPAAQRMHNTMAQVSTGFTNVHEPLLRTRKPCKGCHGR